MKRKNMFKRNSGFIIGCVLAAGASFFTADVLMSDLVLVRTPSTEETERGTVETVAVETAETRTYETDPFTVTASGTIVKGVETEAPAQTETDENGNVVTPQTDEDGNVITPETDEDGNVITPETDENGNVITAETDENGNPVTAETDENGTILSSGGGSTGEDGSSSDGSTGDGSSSGDESSWDGSSSGDSSSGSDYYEQPIEIQDPGNGDYTYSDGSGSGGSSGGSSSGGSSSGGSSGTSTPSDVIIQGISSRYIDESELYNYNAGQLRLIRNEIFALHGRIFRSQDLADYFSQKSWYVPSIDPDEFDANMFDYLNDYEEANLNVILNYEAALAGN